MLLLFNFLYTNGTNGDGTRLICKTHIVVIITLPSRWIKVLLTCFYKSAHVLCCLSYISVRGKKKFDKESFCGTAQLPLSLSLQSPVFFSRETNVINWLIAFSFRFCLSLPLSQSISLQGKWKKKKGHTLQSSPSATSTMSLKGMNLDKKCTMYCLHLQLLSSVQETWWKRQMLCTC